jgi:hypothetical protein
VRVAAVAFGCSVGDSFKSELKLPFHRYQDRVEDNTSTCNQEPEVVTAVDVCLLVA